MLRHLASGKSMTQAEALALFGVGRLAARIHDLSREGHEIRRETVEVKKRNGEMASVARYTLVSSEHALPAVWAFTCMDCDRNGINRGNNVAGIAKCPDCCGRLIVRETTSGHPLLAEAARNRAGRKKTRE